MTGSRVAEAQPRPRPGRPRSEESRTAVLRATSELLHEVGLRAIDLRNWICSINGERLFLKGSNQGPTRHAIAEASEKGLAL